MRRGCQMREKEKHLRSLLMFRFAFALCAMAFPMDLFAQTHGLSPYAGLESREIKSLSEVDLEDLRLGRGWGLALAAELNGVPGPAHLLELDLDAGQVAAIEDIFAAMQAEAQEAGERFIAAEAAIESAFRDGGMTPDALRALIDTSAAARAELRFIHLSRHVETPPLLTA